jgi:anti-anti-sigma factor
MGTLARRTVIVALPEEIDATNAASVAAELATAISGHPAVIIDMSQTRFCDAAGARAIRLAHDRAAGSSTELRLVVTAEPVRRIFTLIGIDLLIDIRPSVAAAYDAMHGGRTDAWQPETAPLGGQGRTRLPDITHLILAEHVRICWLIEELDGALADDGRPGPVSELVLIGTALSGFLESHADAAREIWYPALTRATPHSAAAIRQAGGTDINIHLAVSESRLSRPGSAVWQMAVRAVRTAAMNHVDGLEAGLLDEFELNTSQLTRRALGNQWVAFMGAHALDRPAPAHR